MPSVTDSKLKKVYLKNIAVKPDSKQGFSSLLEKYLLLKKAEGLSENTGSDVLSLIKLFFKRYPRTTKNTLEKNVLLFLSQPNISPYTYNLRLSYLKCFFNFCLSEKYIDKNPLEGLKKRKTTPRIVDVDLKAVKEILEIPDKTTYTGFRDYCLMVLQLDTGIRPKEALSLLLQDYNKRAAQITIRASEAKTRVERTLPLSLYTCKNIDALIKVRPELWNNNNAPLFCDYKGDLTDSAVYSKHIHKYCDILNKNRQQRQEEEEEVLQPVRITPYSFRHIFALNFIRNGGSPFSLQKLMGHSDLNMTKTYIALTQQDLTEEHSKATPLNKVLGVSMKGKNKGKTTTTTRKNRQQ